MPYCEQAGENCPIPKNLRDLCEGSLSEDNIDADLLASIDDGVIEGVVQIVADLVEAGHCSGPETPDKEKLDEVFEVWGPLMGMEMEGSVFCGISNHDEYSRRVDLVYGINLHVTAPEL